MKNGLKGASAFITTASKKRAQGGTAAGGEQKPL